MIQIDAPFVHNMDPEHVRWIVTDDSNDGLFPVPNHTIGHM